MSIKVLHVLRSYLPITENWLYHLLDHTHGVHHTIYCEKFSPGLFVNQKFSFFPLPTVYDPDFGNSFFGKILSVFSKGIRLLFCKTKQHYFSYLIEKENPDILHVHFGTMALVYKSFLLQTDIPFVVSFYGYDYNPIYDYKNIFLKATAIVCEGKAGKKQLSAMGCPIHKIIIVPLGIIPAQNVLIKNKPAGQLKLIQIASFTEKKGHIYAIHAIENVLSVCPNIVLTLIGPNSTDKRQIMEYIKQKKLENYIKIKEAVTPDHLHDELLKYDVFIHPSVTAINGDNEGGAPVVLLNAQNCGLPVISTFHKDIPDYVKNDQTGMLAQEKDITLLSKHIVRFYNMSNNEFIQFSNNAKFHVLNNFNIKDCSKTLTLLYNNIKK